MRILAFPASVFMQYPKISIIIVEHVLRSTSLLILDQDSNQPIRFEG